MVTKNIINEIITFILNDKIKTKNGHFLHNIDVLLKEVTDTDEEHDVLFSDIKIFLKKVREKTNNNKKNNVIDTESLIGKSFKNSDDVYESYENYFGKDDKAKIPDDMAYEGLVNGLLYIGHSHVNGETCFQSDDDFHSLLLYNAKYSWTIDGGFMIVKNDNQHLLDGEKYKHNLDKMENVQKEYDVYKTVLKKYSQFDGRLRSKFSSENDVRKLNSDLINKENANDFFNEKLFKLQQKYIKDNAHEFSNDLNKKISANNVNVYYVSKKKGGV